jgi:hypothetical protein
MQGSRKLRILLVTLRADYGGGPEHVFQLIKQLKDTVDFCVAAPKEEPYWNRIYIYRNDGRYMAYICEKDSIVHRITFPVRKRSREAQAARDAEYADDESD